MEESPFIDSVLGFMGRFLVDRRGRVVVSVLLGALGRFGLMRRPFILIASLIGFSRVPLYVYELLYDEVRTFTQDELLIVCYYPCLREGLVDVLLFAIIIYPIITLFVRVLSRIHEEEKQREDEENL